MASFIKGYFIYLKRGGLYLSELANDGFVPVQWNSSRRSAVKISELGTAFKIIQHMLKDACYDEDYMILSVDNFGVVRNIKMADKQPKKFRTHITFNTGGSIKSLIEAKNENEAIAKMFPELKSRVASIEVAPG